MCGFFQGSRTPWCETFYFQGKRRVLDLMGVPGECLRYPVFCVSGDGMVGPGLTSDIRIAKDLGVLSVRIDVDSADGLEGSVWLR
jgi:hypothetical protein